jgi:hypothetical protein
MTAADFLRPETIETLFYLWRATGRPVQFRRTFGQEDRQRRNTRCV